TRPWSCRCAADPATSGSIALPSRRTKRWLPDPAAPAAPKVTHQNHERQGGEGKQEPVLDMADVVAPQHRQQEPEDDPPGDVPGAVVDSAPSPRCGWHLGDVDAVVVLHLGTGHGDSSGRIGS